MFRLKKFIVPYLGFVFASLILLFIQAMTDLALPDYMADIVNDGVLNGAPSYIISTGAKMLGVTFLGMVASIVVGLLASITAAGISKDLRSALFKKITHFSGAELDHFSTASLITRTTNDVTQIQNVMVIMIRMVFYAPILGVGGIIKAVSESTSMSWVIGIAVTALLAMIGTIFSIAIPKFKFAQNLVDRLNLVARENIEGIPVIRAFNTQPFEEKRFDEANLNLTNTNLFINRLMSVLMPGMMLVMNLTTVTIVWVGSKQVSALNMNIGDMMAYMQYSMQIIMAFLMLSFVFIMLPRASVSAERIAEVLEMEFSIQDLTEPETYTETFIGDIAFEHVDFRYPGGQENVLHDINFIAKAGETTAIIGSTGSGKSTIVNLIMRFYDPTSGRILVGQKDLRQVSRFELRKRIGFVPQKSNLFSGTIRSNLVYSDPQLSEKDLQRASDISQSTDFIKAKEEGFDAPIAQGGSNVSGGQKQRLSIARALAKNAPIHIFDDSFSALDLKTDRKLRAALKEKAANSTTLIVAQRISTIIDAHQIIVIENGKIAGIGTHPELLKSCDVYKEIAHSQLSEEELSR